MDNDILPLVTDHTPNDDGDDDGLSHIQYEDNDDNKGDNKTEVMSDVVYADQLITIGSVSFRPKVVVYLERTCTKSCNIFSQELYQYNKQDVYWLNKISSNDEGSQVYFDWFGYTGESVVVITICQSTGIPIACLMDLISKRPSWANYHRVYIYSSSLINKWYADKRLSRMIKSLIDEVYLMYDTRIIKHVKHKKQNDVDSDQ